MYKIKDIKFDSGEFVPEAFIHVVEKDKMFFLVWSDWIQIWEKFSYIDYKTFDYKTSTFVASDENSNMFHINTKGKRMYERNFCYAWPFWDFDEGNPLQAYVFLNETDSDYNKYKANGFLIDINWNLVFKVIKGEEENEAEIVRLEDKNWNFIEELNEHFKSCYWNRVDWFYQYKEDFFIFLESLLKVAIDDNQKKEIEKVMNSLISIHRESKKRDMSDEEAWEDL